MIGKLKKLDIFGNYLDDSVEKIIIKENVKHGSNINVALRNFLIEECFSNSNESLRLIRMTKNGTVRESAPLFELDFYRLLVESWEDSQLYESISKPFNFLLLEERENQCFYKGCFSWSISEDESNSYAKTFWYNLQTIVNDGVEMFKTPKGVTNNLPGIKDHPILHVRPKARNSSDKVFLPDGNEITRQGVWLNSIFLKELAKRYMEVSKNDMRLNKASINDTPLNKELVKLVTKSILTKQEKDKLMNNMSDSRIIYRFNQKFVKRGNFYVDKQYSSLKEYYMETIKKKSYFYISDFKEFYSQTFSNAIRELNRNLSIVKIEENRYITSLELFKANITKNKMYDFIDSVVFFLENNCIEAFTFYYLKNCGFHHKLMDLGFEDIFYINILENSDVLLNKKIFGVVYFGIGNSEILFHNIIRYQIGTKVHIKGTNLFHILNEEYGAEFIEYSKMIEAFNREKSEIYYADTMEYFFINYEAFLKEVTGDENEY